MYCWKKKRHRVNHVSYLSKSMQTVIIRGSHLENLYFKKRIIAVGSTKRSVKTFSQSLF